MSTHLTRSKTNMTKERSKTLFSFDQYKAMFFGKTKDKDKPISGDQLAEKHAQEIREIIEAFTSNDPAIG